jgi:hypothetical protein
VIPWPSSPNHSPNFPAHTPACAPSHVASLSVVVCGAVCLHSHFVVDEPMTKHRQIRIKSIPDLNRISRLRSRVSSLAATRLLCLVAHTTQQPTTQSNKTRPKATGQFEPLSAGPPLLRHHHLLDLDEKMFISIIAPNKTVFRNDLLFTIVC